ncbi:PREDICTED: uncharacterized protein LOC108363844 isoform X2 [Rhagoletis zephyria]|uniref:uncharacterized protein LOC108363844 isoform X1 n=1 Tax=Rhagoletis zephyria TaxID=28612 RepID=UPI0008116228|nr:PREDICTED: uncharacterized protein LOC108363844 isoform X1 [Rhagoletis zephyria]XP_017472840.1 PREDICTED: uncharacterized protein LOC108363844 isoform X2 [Rhagoletis zephyria]
MVGSTFTHPRIHNFFIIGAALSGNSAPNSPRPRRNRKKNLGLTRAVSANSENTTALYRCAAQIAIDGAVSDSAQASTATENGKQTSSKPAASQQPPQRATNSQAHNLNVSHQMQHYSAMQMQTHNLNVSHQMHHYTAMQTQTRGQRTQPHPHAHPATQERQEPSTTNRQVWLCCVCSSGCEGWCHFRNCSFLNSARDRLPNYLAPCCTVPNYNQQPPTPLSKLTLRICNLGRQCEQLHNSRTSNLKATTDKTNNPKFGSGHARYVQPRSAPTQHLFNATGARAGVTSAAVRG